jgi:hypothetical protein
VSCEFSGLHSLAIPKSVMRKYPDTLKLSVLTLLIEHEILGLDVAMQDVLVVDILQAGDQTGNEKP